MPEWLGRRKVCSKTTAYGTENVVWEVTEVGAAGGHTGRGKKDGKQARKTCSSDKLSMGF